MTQVFGGFHFLLGGGGLGCGEGAGCSTSAGPGSRFFFFCFLQIIMKMNCQSRLQKLISLVGVGRDTGPVLCICHYGSWCDTACWFGVCCLSW